MPSKSIMYDGEFLWLRLNGSQERKLGIITTRKGQLTRIQKIRAVANTGQWIKI